MVIHIKVSKGPSQLMCYRSPFFKRILPALNSKYDHTNTQSSLILPPKSCQENCLHKSHNLRFDFGLQHIEKLNPRINQQHLLIFLPPFLQLFLLIFSLPFSQIFFKFFSLITHQLALLFTQNPALSPYGMPHINRPREDVKKDQGVPTLGTPSLHVKNKFSVSLSVTEKVFIQKDSSSSVPINFS